MKPNEFLFIYNIYNFEILNKRPNNDIKIYYFIKPEWFNTFKDFFNCKEIYKILDANIKNDFFLNIIKADNIPDEFNKIKCKSDTIPPELYDFEYSGEYIVKLNEEETKVSYYPFKVFILEQSWNNSFDINGRSFKFEKRRQGVMVKNTFYAIVSDKILEVFTYNEKEGLFIPLCLFCYNYKYDLFLDLNNNFKYKEIGQYLTELDFPKKEYPKYIRDNKENIIGKIVYLIGDDAPANLDNFISENKKEFELKEALMKELVKKAKEKRLRETQRILKEEKLREKELKEEKRKEKEELKERIRLNKKRIKEEIAQKEYEETLKNKKNKIKKEKEKEKEKENIEEEIRNKEVEERMKKQKEYYEKREQEEKEKERLEKEKTQKEWDEIERLQKEKLELEIIENERKQLLKEQREKALNEKIKEETEKLEAEKRRREAEEKSKEEARQLRIDLLIKEEEERERRTKEEKESKKRLKEKQREEERKRIKEGFERLNKIKQEEKIKEELNKSKIKKELKEKRYWEKIKEETNKLERERIKREQEIILRKKIIEDTRNLEQEKKLTKSEKKIKNEEKKIREEQQLKHIINNKEEKEITPSKKNKRAIKNEKNKRSENIKNNSEIISYHSSKNKKEIISVKSQEKTSFKNQESKEVSININNIQTTEGDYGSEVDKRFRNIEINIEKSEDYDNNEDDGKEPKIGLKNVEAMCYMNATIQCFSKTIDLTNFFLAPQNKNRIFFNNALLKDEKAIELCTSYYEVIENLWNKKNKEKFFVPKNFKEKLRKMNPLFQGYNSGEPKDLIKFILLKLHEELNIVKKTKEKVDKNKLHSKYNVYDRFNVLNEFLTDMKIQNNSIISDLFYGVIENISECLVCKEKNKKKGLNRKFKYAFKTINYFLFPLEEIRKFRNNKFLKINANIMTPNMMTDIINNNRVFIMDCFEFYQNPLVFKADNGDDQLYCEICQKNRDANFRTKIYYPPNIMILVLDRGDNIKYKIGIDFVTSIDITQYVDKEFTLDNKFEYDLYGVITFIGENIKSGKYIAFCKCHDDTKKWVCYNDDNVAEIVDFISQVHNYGLPCALFYEKKLNE